MATCKFDLLSGASNAEKTTVLMGEFVIYVWWLVENPVVEDPRGRESGDQGMMSQHFRGEKSLEELVTAHIFLILQHWSWTDLSEGFIQDN